MSKHTKEVILKKAMSKKYCGSTRYDFLDDEEISLIYKAMQIYADQEIQSLRTKLENLKTWIIENTVDVEGQDGGKWNCIERDELLQQLNER